MSWHCSRALVEEFLGVTYLDGEPSALSSTTPTPEAFYWPDKTTEHSRLSRFGMTSERLTAGNGEELLTWFREVSLAKTSAQLDEATDSTVNEVGFGRKWLGLLARLDRDSLSWRTPQCSLLGDSDEFSETWPRWGSMRNGECWERQTLEHPTNEIGSGLWPTPNCIGYRSDGELLLLSRKLSDRSEYLAMSDRACNSKRERFWPTPRATDGTKGGPNQRGSKGDLMLPSAVAQSTSAAGRLNPEWVEWLMGWPIGLTDLKPLATDRFQEWRQQHSICSHEVKNAA
jgi:hypothetical protein